MPHSRKAVLSILDTHTPPYVGTLRRKTQFCLQKVGHAIGPLREHLIGMPVCLIHDLCNPADVIIRNVFVEQIAHRIDEDHPGGPPAERLQELFRNEPKVESLLVRVARHSTKALCESFSVAMRAAGADLRASPHRIPGCVSPFDLGICGHLKMITRLVSSGALLVACDGNRIPGARTKYLVWYPSASV